MEVFYGLLIPFLGTTLGSAMVFFMKNKINNKVEKMLLGFASGVMIAASIWSLMIPSIDMAKEQGKVSWMPAAIGFLLGIFFLLILDKIIPHLHVKSDRPEGLKAKFQRTTMMVLAVTLHNIPEGMAVRSCICRGNGWKYENNLSRSNSTCNWYCNTEFPRRCDYINAT